MDEEAIEACLTSASFDGVLRGIVSVDQFSTDTAPMDGDSYVFNTDVYAGQHWFAILYAAGIWYLFDSSELSPEENHQRIVNKLKCNVSMQVGKLQAASSLTCGEHSIVFLYCCSRLLKDVGNLRGINYCKTLIAAAESLGDTPDQLVTNFVYSGGIFDVAKPKLSDVDAWLDRLGM